MLLGVLSMARRHVAGLAMRSGITVRPHRQSLSTLIVLAAIVSILGTALGASPAAADPFSDRIAAARARQAELGRSVARQDRLLDDLARDATQARSVIAASGRQLDSIGADLAALRKDIAAATAALDRVQTKRAALGRQLQELDRTLDMLEQQISLGARDLDLRRRALGDRLADAHRAQGTSLLEQILGSGSFTDVLADASAYLSYADEDRRMAESIANDQAALDSLRAINAATRYRTDQLRRAAQDAAADLRAQKADLRAQKLRAQALERKVRAKQREQLRRAQRIAGSQRQARAAARAHQVAQRRLDQKISNLVRAAERRAAAERRREAAARRAAESRRRAEQSRRDTAPSGTGRFLWPAAGYVTQEYGCTGFYLEPRRGNCAHFHDGIDIAGVAGTPVRAADNGVVAFVGFNPYDRDPAYIVVIGHSGGFSTSYAHLQPRRKVRAGQSIKRGQVIGYMGSTGNSTGSHLHWEMRRGGGTVNPRRYS
jgi:murein DD-endopeptidase MepM/ murein hydrolase activator NlpD